MPKTFTCSADMIRDITPKEVWDIIRVDSLTLVNRNVASLYMSWICQSTTSGRGPLPLD